MFYLDTNVILSYSYETEKQHWRAVDLIENETGIKLLPSNLQ